MAVNWHEVHRQNRSLGARMADKVANGLGSWGFIITQTIFVIIWMTLNIIGLVQHWDPFPFILLNLIFSTQAAYAAPIILMSQNRAAERDRHHAAADYQTDVESREKIDTLAHSLHRIEKEKLDKIIALLEKP